MHLAVTQQRRRVVEMTITALWMPHDDIDSARLPRKRQQL